MTQTAFFILTMHIDQSTANVKMTSRCFPRPGTDAAGLPVEDGLGASSPAVPGKRLHHPGDLRHRQRTPPPKPPRPSPIGAQRSHACPFNPSDAAGLPVRRPRRPGPGRQRAGEGSAAGVPAARRGAAAPGEEPGAENQRADGRRR